jgi:hypothetical protein
VLHPVKPAMKNSKELAAISIYDLFEFNHGCFHLPLPSKQVIDCMAKLSSVGIKAFQ